MFLELAINYHAYLSAVYRNLPRIFDLDLKLPVGSAADPPGLSPRKGTTLETLTLSTLSPK